MPGTYSLRDRTVVSVYVRTQGFVSASYRALTCAQKIMTTPIKMRHLGTGDVWVSRLDLGGLDST